MMVCVPSGHFVELVDKQKREADVANKLLGFPCSGYHALPTFMKVPGHVPG